MRTVTPLLNSIGICQIFTFTELTPFFTHISQVPDTIILLVYEGPLGVEIAWNIHDRQPEAPLIWFSDLDFAITAYRFRVKWFGLLPVTEDVLRIGLERVCRDKDSNCLTQGFSWDGSSHESLYNDSHS